MVVVVVGCFVGYFPAGLRQHHPQPRTDIMGTSRIIYFHTVLREAKVAMLTDAWQGRMQWGGAFNSLRPFMKCIDMEAVRAI